MTSRKVAGWKAKREGKNWESAFETACSFESVTCVRIPEGCRSLGKFKLMRVKSPFDYVLGYRDRLACVDLKSFGTGKSLTYSQIDPNQLRQLFKLSRDGIAGYVVNFREIDKIVFFSASDMSQVQKRSSLSEGIILGGSLSLDVRKLFF